MVMFVDPAGKNKNKLCECTSLWEICNDKIIPRTLIEIWIATQVIRFDAPVHQRFVIHLDEPVLSDLDRVCQILMVKHE